MKAWIKLYTEILDDRKMSRLTDRQHRVFINLLALSGIIDKDGLLMSTEDLAYRLRMTEGDLEHDLNALSGLNMVANKCGVWSIVHWAERQPITPSETPEATRERKRQQREREKSQRDADVTASHDVTKSVTAVTAIEENREEESRGEKTVTPPPAMPAPDWWTRWVESFPQGQMPNPIDKKNLQAVVSEVGEQVVVEAIDYANKHKHTPTISLAYVEAIVDGWRADGKLGSRGNGNGREPPKAKRKRKHFAPDGSMEEMEF